MGHGVSQTMSSSSRRLFNKKPRKSRTTSDFSTVNCHYPPHRTSPPCVRRFSIMPSSRSEFAELLHLLATDDRHRSVSGELSPYLSRLSENGTQTPSNSHRRDKSEAASPPADSEFPFTFKQMIHTLYDARSWAEKVKDVIEDSKTQFKPLPEELKSPRLSNCKASDEEGSQIRTIKKRCTGRTHIPDPVFVPKPTYVSHHARTSTVDLHIEGRKSEATASPTKRRPSQSRTTQRPTLTLNTGVHRPRHRSLTRLDARSPLHSLLTPFSDSEDSESEEPVTLTDVKPIFKLPPLKIPKRSSTTLTVPNQSSTLKDHRQTSRIRSLSFGGPTCPYISPVFRAFEPDGKWHVPLSGDPYRSRCCSRPHGEMINFASTNRRSRFHHLHPSCRQPRNSVKISTSTL